MAILTLHLAFRPSQKRPPPRPAPSQGAGERKYVSFARPWRAKDTKKALAPACGRGLGVGIEANDPHALVFVRKSCRPTDLWVMISLEGGGMGK